MKQACRLDVLASTIAWAAFLVLAFVSVSAAGTQKAEYPPEMATEDVSGLHVQVSEGLLSVELEKGVPLSQVLHAVAQQGGFRLSIRGNLGDVRPQTFAKVPLRNGIEWLAGSHNLVMIHNPSARRVAEVRVYEGSHRKQAAIEPSPPPPPPDFWMWSRRLREDSGMISR